MSTQLRCSIFTQLRMFNVHRIEKVVGPVFGPIFGQKSDFFGVVPGVFPGGFGIVERYSREVPRVFRVTFFGSVQEGLPVCFQHSQVVFENLWKKVFWGLWGVRGVWGIA